MHRGTRKITSTALAVLLGAAVAAVGLVIGAGPAAALSSGCPTGSYTRLDPDLGVTFCYDRQGSYVGYSNSNGTFVQGTTEATPVQVDEPSSVIEAGEPAGATAAEGAGIAEVDAGLAGGDVLIAEGAGDVAAQGIPGLDVAIDSYLLGTTIDKFACSAGFGWFCKPHTDKVTPFQPNGDVGTDPQGWTVNAPPWSMTGVGGTFSGIGLTPSGIAYGQLAGTGAGAWTFNAAVNAGYANQSVRFNLYALCNNGAMYGVVQVSSPSLAGSGGYNGSGPMLNPCNGGAATQFWHWDLAQVTYNGYAVTPTATMSDPQCVSTCQKVFAIWHPAGDPNRPTFNGNPNRQWETEAYCNGSFSSLNGSAAFTENDLGQNLGTVPAYPAVPSCPSGQALTEFKIIEHSLTGTPADKIVKDYVVPNAIQTWRSTYPGCASGVCRLGLYKNASSGLVNCFSAQPTDLCNGWFTDPNKISDYTCTYGPTNTSSDAAVALSECNVYAPSFDPVNQAKGAVLGDPATGSTGDGQPGSQTDPGSSTEPDQPSAGGVAGAPLPGQDGASCYPSGWAAFNPLEWVYKPVKCVLVWAFVPDTSAVTQEFTATWSDVSSKPPVSIVLPMVSFVQGMAGGVFGSCGGNIADFGNGLVVPCQPPAGISSYIGAVKLVIEVLLFGLTAFALWSMAEKSMAK